MLNTIHLDEFSLYFSQKSRTIYHECRAIEIDPNNSDTWKNRGYALANSVNSHKCCMEAKRNPDFDLIRDNPQFKEKTYIKISDSN